MGEVSLYNSNVLKPDFICSSTHIWLNLTATFSFGLKNLFIIALLVSFTLKPDGNLGQGSFQQLHQAAGDYFSIIFN